MTYIKRHLETLLLHHLYQASPPYDCLLLGGARQCGKSTLLEHLFPPTEHVHINLASEGEFCDSIDRTHSFDDFTFLLESRFQVRIGGEKILIFDEAQLSKKLGGYVRFMKEKWRHQHVILTGSTLTHLFDHHQKPTGRVVEFVLRPFNFMEFLEALQKDTLLEKLNTWEIDKPFSETIHHEILMALKEYLQVGGLPEVVFTYKEGGDYLRKLANIFAFYKRDFETKAATDHLTDIFSQIFLRIAASTGAPIKLSSIIKSSSPGYRKVKDVLSLLERWHQIIKVNCEVSNLSKVGQATPKRYLFDHGIRFLQNPTRFQDLDLLDPADLHREELGGLIENFVLTELLSTNNPLMPRSWEKTHQSGLVDFLFTDQGKTHAVEVKASTRFNKKHLSSLLAYKESYPKSSLILTNLDRGGRYPLGGKEEILHIPVYALYSHFRTLIMKPI